MADPRAGTLAQPSDLVDVAHLVTAYYTLEPDPDDVDQQVAFGTSGHRGSSLDTAFNEVHIAATTQAICDYRKEQGYDGPLFLGRDTHGLSEPAWATAIEVLVANDVTVMVDDRDGYTPTPAVSHAIIRANDGRTSGSRTGRRHRGHAEPQPAQRRGLQVQPAPRRPRRHRRDEGHRGARERADPGQPRGRPPDHVLPRPRRVHGVRLPRDVRRRPADRGRPRRDQARRASGSAPTRSAARASSTGARSPTGTGSTSPW